MIEPKPAIEPVRTDEGLVLSWWNLRVGLDLGLLAGIALGLPLWCFLPAW